jgi:DNA-binding HxlR family transcriptional regulator
VTWFLQWGEKDRAEYALTELGKTLQAPLAAICAWAAEHA